MAAKNAPRPPPAGFVRAGVREFDRELPAAREDELRVDDALVRLRVGEDARVAMSAG